MLLYNVGRALRLDPYTIHIPRLLDMIQGGPSITATMGNTMPLEQWASYVYTPFHTDRIPQGYALPGIPLDPERPE
jgi:hypothetical protein